MAASLAIRQCDLRHPVPLLRNWRIRDVTGRLQKSRIIGTGSTGGDVVHGLHDRKLLRRGGGEELIYAQAVLRSDLFDLAVQEFGNLVMKLMVAGGYV